MLKRRPETQYSRDGEALKNSPEAEDKNISTAEEIKSRKIFKAKRITVQEKQAFILKNKLISDSTESDLLKETSKPSVNFLSVPDEEIKETSPEKQKPVSKFEGPKYLNPFSSIIQSLETKKESEVLNSFISSVAPKKAEPVSTYFSLKPLKSDLNTAYLVEATTSVNGVSRGEGYVELASGDKSGKKLLLFIIKNKIKNVVFQGSLSSNSTLTPCADVLLQEDDGDLIEFSTTVFTKESEKVQLNEVRICVKKCNEKGLLGAFTKIKE